jgi:hypothetical protein
MCVYVCLCVYICTLNEKELVGSTHNAHKYALDGNSLQIILFLIIYTCEKESHTIRIFSILNICNAQTIENNYISSLEAIWF